MDWEQRNEVTVVVHIRFTVLTTTTTMVVPMERNRRTTAFRRFLQSKAGRARSRLRRGEDAAVPDTVPEEDRQEAETNSQISPAATTSFEHSTTTTSRCSTVPSFKVVPAKDNHRLSGEDDIELSIASLDDDDDEGIREDLSNKSSLQDDKDGQVILHGEPSEQSGMMRHKKASIMITETSQVEFQDDNNQVFTLEYYDFAPTEEDYMQRESKSVTAVDSLDGTNGSVKKQPWGTDSSTAASEADSKRQGSQQVDSRKERDYSMMNYQRSIFNGSMVSRLTSQASETECSSAASFSETSSYESEFTPTIPGILVVRTTTDGTKELVGRTQSWVSSIRGDRISEEEDESESEDEIENDRSDSDSTSISSSEEEDSEGDDEDESISDSGDWGEQSDEESLEQPSQANDKVEDNNGGQETDKTKDNKTKDVLSDLDAALERIATLDDDAFVDMPAFETMYSLDDTLDNYTQADTLYTEYSEGDNESAFLEDDNNVPFVDSIQAEKAPAAPLPEKNQVRKSWLW